MPKQPEWKFSVEVYSDVDGRRYHGKTLNQVIDVLTKSKSIKGKAQQKDSFTMPEDMSKRMGKNEDTITKAVERAVAQGTKGFIVDSAKGFGNTPGLSPDIIREFTDELTGEVTTERDELKISGVEVYQEYDKKRGGNTPYNRVGNARIKKRLTDNVNNSSLGTLSGRKGVTSSIGVGVDETGSKVVKEDFDIHKGAFLKQITSNKSSIKDVDNKDGTSRKVTVHKLIPGDDIIDVIYSAKTKVAKQIKNNILYKVDLLTLSFIDHNGKTRFARVKGSKNRAFWDQLTASGTSDSDGNVFIKFSLKEKVVRSIITKSLKAIDDGNLKQFEASLQGSFTKKEIETLVVMMQDANSVARQINEAKISWFSESPLLAGKVKVKTPAKTSTGTEGSNQQIRKGRFVSRSILNAKLQEEIRSRMIQGGGDPFPPTMHERSGDFRRSAIITKLNYSGRGTRDGIGTLTYTFLPYYIRNEDRRYQVTELIEMSIREILVREVGRMLNIVRDF